MNCREARELIHAACDGEIDVRQQDQLVQHLDSCRQCFAYEKAMGCLKGRIRAVAVTADLSAADAVLTRFLESPATAAPTGPILPGFFLRPGFLRTVAALAFFTAAIFVGISLLAPGTSLAGMVIEQHRMRLVGQLLLDTTADCCQDLEEWFQGKTGRPINVPEICYEGTVIEGGTYHKHPTGNEIYLAAYTIDEKPVTLCVCTGPNMNVGKGTTFVSNGISATMMHEEDFTLISWQAGMNVIALVTPFDEAKSKDIFASIK